MTSCLACHVTGFQGGILYPRGHMGRFWISDKQYVDSCWYIAFRVFFCFYKIHAGTICIQSPLLLLQDSWLMLVQCIQSPLLLLQDFWIFSVWFSTRDSRELVSHCPAKFATHWRTSQAMNIANIQLIL